MPYEHLRNLARPYMVRFTEEGFTREGLIIEYIEKVVLPYQESLKKKVCIVSDKAPSHFTSNVKDYLEVKRIHYLFIPSGTTYLLQPLDVGINKTLKNKVRTLCIEWL